jgi:hypothetical protein
MTLALVVCALALGAVALAASQQDPTLTRWRALRAEPSSRRENRRGA